MQFILGVIILLNIPLIFIVLRRHFHSLLHQVLALHIAGVIGWTLAILINIQAESLLIERFIFASAALSLTAVFWFVKLFPDGTKPRHIIEYWSLVVGGFFVAASFWPGALFTMIEITDSGYTILDLGFLS